MRKFVFDVIVEVVANNKMSTRRGNPPISLENASRACGLFTKSERQALAEKFSNLLLILFNFPFPFTAKIENLFVFFSAVHFLPSSNLKSYKTRLLSFIWHN